MKHLLDLIRPIAFPALGLAIAGAVLFGLVFPDGARTISMQVEAPSPRVPVEAVAPPTPLEKASAMLAQSALVSWLAEAIPDFPDHSPDLPAIGQGRSTGSSPRFLDVGRP